jgi:hypothetical protein
MLTNLEPSDMDVIRLRDLVLANLDEMGLGKARWLGERLLFRDRYYIGLSFDFEGISAIWRSDAGELRFVDERGAMIKAVPVSVAGGHAIARQAA